jgi:hypothetical protein
MRRREQVVAMTRRIDRFQPASAAVEHPPFRPQRRLRPRHQRADRK